MEPPSPALAAALSELRLAAPRDLKRAAGRCRAIARDLPAFDCVWIDALLAAKRLTPFQAERLQAGRAGDLRIGGFVVLDRLGLGVGAATYLARPIGGGARRVLKVIEPGTDRRDAIRSRLETLRDAGRTLGSPHLVTPEAVLEEDSGNGPRLILVSRYVEGTDARARLMRSGRFREVSVAEIARQLTGALAAAHRAGLPHGDIGLTNLRLTPQGIAVLVDHGVTPAAVPVLSIDETRPPERYDGTAPERIGTAAPATAESDTYALGCLLWHLLAGRPPFATGDPLAKLTAHRLRPVPDVRDFAPDAPDELTALISAMTDLAPSRRPDDLDAARRRLPKPGSARRLLWQSPAAPPTSGRARWPIAAAILFAVAGLAYSSFDQAGSAALLTATFGDSANVSSPAVAHPAERPLAPLPTPDPAGVIALDHPGPFAVADVSFRGPLVLRGRPERPATILVTDRPLHLWADGVTLEHVRVLHAPAGTMTAGPPALLLVETQNLAVRSCRFETPPRPQGERHVGPAAIAWRLIDRDDPTAGRVELRDAVFRGGRQAVFLGDRARRIAFENVLGVGQRALLSLGPARDSALRLKNVTLRDAAAVVACRGGASPARLDVLAEDSILDLGESGTLVAAEGPAPEVRWSGVNVFTANEVALPTRDTILRTAAVTGDDHYCEGVVRADVSFVGPAVGSDAASVARVSGAPRLAGRPPGIDLARLPRSAPDAGRPR